MTRRSPVTGMCDSCAQSFIAHVMALVIYEGHDVHETRVRKDLTRAQERCLEIHPDEEEVPT